ncbi:MAG: hypothetical protein WCX29_00745 [Candidatus Peribacteraceae bacterium]|jgi:hypothetical protein|nr:hypothetical protein [Candidatus Peribacteria bacterium]
MSTWLDVLPSRERQKLREMRMRSPAEYAKLRERIKSVEQITEEMQYNEYVAELKFALATEPAVRDALKDRIADDLREQGIEAVMEHVPDAQRAAVESGRFTVSLESHPQTRRETLAVLPEGDIQETLPIVSALSEKYIQQFIQSLQNE